MRHRLDSLTPRVAALLVLTGAVLTIGGALIFEHGLGYVPCKLCLTERVPYYLAIPLALIAALGPVRIARPVLGLIALILLYGAGLGIYHAGAEWSFWPGPSDCGGGTGAAPGDVGGLLDSLKDVHVVDCTSAAWRFLGVSLAGWNAIIAACLAFVAAHAALRRAGAGRAETGLYSPGR